MPEIRYIPLCTPVPGGGCDHHGPDCPTPGKRPLHPDWANNWTRERPEGNAGVLCGPDSGLLVIDVDTDEAEVQYAMWLLPDTFTVRSGRGEPGRHYYFRWPAGLQRVPNRLDGVEIKGPGRQVVAWDSLHKSGRRYEKLGGQFAELPDWFVSRLRDSAAQHDHVGVVDALPEALRALDRLLAVLPDAYEQRDGNWVATCPAHDDRDPSLVVTASGERLLVHCRAGCPTEAVMEALDMTMYDLRARPEAVLDPARLVQLGDREPRARTGTQLGTRFKLSDLMAATLPEKQWIVPDLLPGGLSLLAGPPKLGKSWLVLDVAISVAAGRPVLDRDVDQGDVLYLALEDNEGRLQRRARVVLGDTPPPDRLELWTRAGTLTSGLVPEIEDWLDMQKAPRLVIIDTLGRVQQGSAWVDSKDGGYADAVQALGVLQAVASERNVAVVVITHTKKGGWSQGADPLEAVLGSQGYAGTADAVLVMKRERGSANGELFVTGREVDEEVTESIWFDRDTCRWVVGDADYDGADGLDPLQAKLLDVFDGKGYEWQTYEALAGVVHRRESEVREAVEALEAAGLADKRPRPGRGRKGWIWGPKVVLPPGLAQ